MGGYLTYRRVGGESVFELTIPSTDLPGRHTTGRVDVVATELAEVWLSDDGILRVDYHPGAGIEDLEHAAAVVEASVTIADGQKPPLVVITGRLRPDADARRLYTETSPTIANALVANGPNRGLVKLAHIRVERGLMEAEMSERLGYDRHYPAGPNTGVSLNGHGRKRCTSRLVLVCCREVVVRV